MASGLEPEDLGAAVRTRGPLSAAEAREVLEQVARALGALHASGRAHLALSPEAIAIARAGPGRKIEATLRDSGEGAKAGPLEAAFRAPEQLRGKAKKAGPAADVWSLGQLAFFALIGEPYFRPGADHAATAQEVLDGARPAASARAAEVLRAGALPPGFDAWFSRCLSERPQDRFATAEEAHRALAPLLWAGPAQGSAPRGRGRGAARAVLGAALVAFTLGGAAFFFMTRRPSNPKREACIEATGRMLATMKQPLELTAYVTRGTPKLDAFVEELTAVLKEYERVARGKITLKIVEPKTDGERHEAKESGLQESAFGDMSGNDQALITRGFLGIVFRYGTEHEAIPYLAPDNPKGLEFWISNKIREVRARADGLSTRIGVIAGKGEISIAEPNLLVQPGGKGPTLQGVIEQALPYYKFEQVDLKGGEAEVPPELSALLVTQPGQGFTDNELRRMDAFMMRGSKGLAVFASAVNVAAQDPKMTATLDARGLDRLLAGYGVEMKPDLVLDWGSPFRIVLTGAALPVPAIALVTSEGEGGPPRLDGSFAPFFRLDEVVFPFPSSLVPRPEKQPAATVQVVARSTARAASEVGEARALWPSGQDAPRGDLAERALAISVEGKVAGAFGEGSAERTRIVVVSSSQFLANPLARAGAADGDSDAAMLSQYYAQRHLTTMILAFKNTLDWISNEDDLAACSATLGGN